MSMVFSVNNTPATGAAAMFALKTLLKAAGWTVPRSSDGSTYNSSGDQISSGSSGAGGMDNARAWFVIVQPSSGSAPYSGTRQFCIQRNSSTGANTSQSWRIKYSFSNAFSGGSPSATQTPSAASEVIQLGGGTDASPTFGGLFGGADGAYRFHAMADNASPFGFYSFAYPSSVNTAPNMGFMMDPMVSTFLPSGETEPYVIYTDNSTGNVTTMSVGNLTVETACAFGYMNKGIVGESYSRIPMLCYTSFTAAFNRVFPDQAGTDPFNSKAILVPVMYARRSGMGSPVGFKGVSANIKFPSTTKNNGDTYTVSSSADYIHIGQLALPWNGTTPLQ